MPAPGYSSYESMITPRLIYRRARAIVALVLALRDEVRVLWRTETVQKRVLESLRWRRAGLSHIVNVTLSI